MEYLSQASQMVWVIGANEAASLSHEFIEIEHIFIGLCKISDFPLEELMTKLHMDISNISDVENEIQKLSGIFEEFDVDPVHMRRSLRRRMGVGSVEFSGQAMHRSSSCKGVFEAALKICQARKGTTVELLDFLLAIVIQGNNKACELMIAEGVDLRELQSSIVKRMQVKPREEGPEAEGIPTIPKKGKAKAPAEGEEGEEPKVSKTPLLNKHGRDLTQLAREGKLGPVIGRKEEIKKVAQTLCQKRKNNPILVGDAGVGKTCVVEGLAQKAISPGVAPEIKDKRIVEISMSSLVAGTKYRGEFEERLQKILDEAKSGKDIVIFIDEIHTIVGAGGGGDSMDAANILKPALARGDIHCIGATTTQEYRKYIEKDAALARRFQLVWIDEPTKDEAIQIMKGLKNSFESHHGVQISDEAIRGAVELSIRYLNDFRLPDKAIDLIDQACVQQKLKSLTFKPGQKSTEFFVDFEDIAKVVSKRCRIPLERLTAAESDKILHIEKELGKRIIGQDHAIAEVCKAVRAAKAGLEDPRKPQGVFLFLGSTGIGKTELAKALTEFLFDDENKLIRFDMSEFMEKHTVSKLIGAPPGYVGYEEEGQLTGRVRTNPYSVLLFDEIEKAHPDVSNIFLQIFDEGRLTDSQGRRADFRSTVIIMTSNLGTAGVSRQKPHIGIPVSEGEAGVEPQRAGGIDRERYQQAILTAVKGALSPELFNRIRKVIIFYPLTREDTRKIIDKLLGKVKERLVKRALDLEVEGSVYDILMEKGYSEAYGVREMERTVEDLISVPLANEILSDRFSAGQTIVAKAQEGKIIFENKEASNDSSTLRG